MLNVKTEVGVRVKRERGLSSSVRRDGSFIQTPIYKVTVKAFSDTEQGWAQIQVRGISSF